MLARHEIKLDISNMLYDVAILEQNNYTSVLMSVGTDDSIFFGRGLPAA